jgi:hypothetical protein
LYAALDAGHDRVYVHAPDDHQEATRELSDACGGRMAYLKVRVIYKDVRYAAEIDDAVNPTVLAKQLAKEIPDAPKDGDFRLALYDEVAIREGVTLELIEVPARAVRFVEREQ